MVRETQRREPLWPNAGHLTQADVESREAQRHAATPIDKTFASLRPFVRWANDQPGGVFAEVGLTTGVIKERTVDEPYCKKLERCGMHRLFTAADNLVLTERLKIYDRGATGPA